MPQVREWSSQRYSLDGGPIIHQGFCCSSGEGQGDREDEERGGRSATTTASEDGWTI